MIFDKHYWPTLTDINGNYINKDPWSYPYSYDQFCLYLENYNMTDRSVCSDRLYERNSNLYERCTLKVWENTSQCFYNRKPKEIEKFLSYYYNQNIKLTGVEQACNQDNGYPYWIFYYKTI